MDSWPVDDRTQLATNTARKGKAKQAAAVRNYLDLERGANAVTLVERNDRLEWSSVVENVAQGPNHLHMGKCTTIFPATRSPPDLQTKSTIIQSAERGANFLRTFLPEVDIPAELIRDELSGDAKITERLKEFDPYLGNLLEKVVARDATFLALPMGELNRELNLSSFRQSENDLVFKPSAHSVLSFDTPIQQISISRPLNFLGLQNSYLGVRTFGLTSIFEVNTSRNTPYLTEAVTILHSDTANRALVDICISPSPFEGLLVNDHGTVYKCGVSNGRKYLNKVYFPPPDVDEEKRDSFWRLARSDADNYLLASRKSLINIDLRITNSSQELFSLPEQGDVLTSVEDQQTHHIVKLCSTREILWIDTRFAGKPLLGYRHGRQYDRYLNARTSPLSSGSTLLTSRNNAMVTVYDVTCSEGQLLHVNEPPYCMIPGDKAGALNVGQTLFKHPLHTNDTTFSLLRLTERGCLQQVDLHVSDSSDPSPIFRTSWSTDVKQLDTAPLHPKPAPHAKQAFTEVDFSEAYKHIYDDHDQERVKKEEENANAVYDLLETAPTFWQEAEPPLEHLITTYDAVFRAGDDPEQNERADFLTESFVNSTRGYRAMSQGRLTAKTLMEGAAWHHNITPILRRFDHNFPEDVQSGTNALKRHDLAEDPERSIMSLRYENEAREQLALDLALSTDVFSSQKFSTVAGEGSDLETMARTLSLAGEPPTVDFGYLHPRHTNHYSKEGKDKEAADSIGVRLLLKDWEVGADPENHLFVDHYNGTVSAPQPVRRAGPSQAPGMPRQPVGTQPQRPPMILATSTIPSKPPEALQRLTGAQSQGSLMPSRTIGFGSQMPFPPNVPQSSQEYMMSTQVLPGVHGGRPTIPKKKVAKKRVGGF